MSKLIKWGLLAILAVAILIKVSLWLSVRSIMNDAGAGRAEGAQGRLHLLGIVVGRRLQRALIRVVGRGIARVRGRQRGPGVDGRLLITVGRVGRRFLEVDIRIDLPLL